MASDSTWRDQDSAGQLQVPGDTRLNLSPYALDPSYLPKGPEFIFPVETRQRSWNEKWFDRVGTSYLTGTAAGGVWGVWDGVRSAEGTSMRLRANSLLNGLTRRGPYLGNTFAVLALLYSPLESVIGHYRGTQDSANSIAAGAITGALFKSTAGVRAMAVGSGAGCAVIGGYTLFKYFTRERTGSVFDYV